MPMTISGDGVITGLVAGGLPDATVTSGDIVDGAITPAKLSQALTLGTAVATTSGTVIDFNSIPSWVKRITVSLRGVSTSSISNLVLQLGSGSVDATGYISTASSAGGTVSSVTSGFALTSVLAAIDTVSGIYILTQHSGNVWIGSGTVKTNTTQMNYGAGEKSLSGVLDRLRLTTVNGTDTFDAGSVNILYEG